MANFLTRAVEMELGEHPAVKDRPDLAELAEKASEALFSLTEKLGLEIVYILHPEERLRDHSGKKGRITRPPEVL